LRALLLLDCIVDMIHFDEIVTLASRIETYLDGTIANKDRVLYQLQERAVDNDAKLSQMAREAKTREDDIMTANDELRRQLQELEKERHETNDHVSNIEKELKLRPLGDEITNLQQQHQKAMDDANERNKELTKQLLSLRHDMDVSNERVDNDRKQMERCHQDETRLLLLQIDDAKSLEVKQKQQQEYEAEKNELMSECNKMRHELPSLAQSIDEQSITISSLLKERAAIRTHLQSIGSPLILPELSNESAMLPSSKATVTHLRAAASLSHTGPSVALAAIIKARSSSTLHSRASSTENPLGLMLTMPPTAMASPTLVSPAAQTATTAAVGTSAVISKDGAPNSNANIDNANNVMGVSGSRRSSIAMLRASLPPGPSLPPSATLSQLDQQQRQPDNKSGNESGSQSQSQGSLQEATVQNQSLSTLLSSVFPGISSNDGKSNELSSPSIAELPIDDTLTHHYFAPLSPDEVHTPHVAPSLPPHDQVLPRAAATAAAALPSVTETESIGVIAPVIPRRWQNTTFREHKDTDASIRAHSDSSSDDGHNINNNSNSNTNSSEHNDVLLRKLLPSNDIVGDRSKAPYYGRHSPMAEPAGGGEPAAALERLRNSVAEMATMDQTLAQVRAMKAAEAAASALATPSSTTNSHHTRTISSNNAVIPSPLPSISSPLVTLSFTNSYPLPTISYPAGAAAAAPVTAAGRVQHIYATPGLDINVPHLPLPLPAASSSLLLAHPQRSPPLSAWPEYNETGSSRSSSARSHTHYHSHSRHNSNDNNKNGNHHHRRASQGSNTGGESGSQSVPGSPEQKAVNTTTTGGKRARHKRRASQQSVGSRSNRPSNSRAHHRGHQRDHNDDGHDDTDDGYYTTSSGNNNRNKLDQNGSHSDDNDDHEGDDASSRASVRSTTSSAASASASASRAGYHRRVDSGNRSVGGQSTESNDGRPRVGARNSITRHGSIAGDTATATASGSGSGIGISPAVSSVESNTIEEYHNSRSSQSSGGSMSIGSATSYPSVPTSSLRHQHQHRTHGAHIDNTSVDGGRTGSATRNDHDDIPVWLPAGNVPRDTRANHNAHVGQARAASVDDQQIRQHDQRVALAGEALQSEHHHHARSQAAIPSQSSFALSFRSSDDPQRGGRTSSKVASITPSLDGQPMGHAARSAYLNDLFSAPSAIHDGYTYDHNNMGPASSSSSPMPLSLSHVHANIARGGGRSSYGERPIVVDNRDYVSAAYAHLKRMHHHDYGYDNDGAERGPTAAQAVALLAGTRHTSISASDKDAHSHAHLHAHLTTPIQEQHDHQNSRQNYGRHYPAPATAPSTLYRRHSSAGDDQLSLLQQSFRVPLSSDGLTASSVSYRVAGNLQSTAPSSRYDQDRDDAFSATPSSSPVQGPAPDSTTYTPSTSDGNNVVHHSNINNMGGPSTPFQMVNNSKGALPVRGLTIPTTVVRDPYSHTNLSHSHVQSSSASSPFPVGSGSSGLQSMTTPQAISMLASSSSSTPAGLLTDVDRQALRNKFKQAIIRGNPSNPLNVSFRCHSTFHNKLFS
jgi:hypothetical protein